MINYGEMAKEVAKALKKDDKLFNEFVSNYSKVMLLDRDICERIVKNINTNGDCEFHYCFFNTEYDVGFLKVFATNTEYIIDQIDEYDYSVFLTQDNEDVEWIPVIFVKEFWDFYFDYINKKKESEKMVCSSKLGGKLKQNEINIDSICKTIAEDFVKNYDSYTDVFNALNSFSNLSENDCVEFITNFFKRLF